MGKIYTWIGYELVENIGNPNYTHGTVYNNAIPFTHTGMSFDVSEFLPSDKWGLTLYAVNGWDTYIDNNESKTGGFYLTYQPNDDFFISLATIIGAEGWGSHKNGTDASTDDGDATMMYDIVATYALPQVDKLSLGFNWDHGYARDRAGTDNNNPNSGAHWWAAVGYAMYDFTDNQQGAFRYEYFDDTDGAKGFDQSMWTATYTHNITIHDNLMLRPEIRYNKYNGGERKEIASGGNPRNTEDNETIFAFGAEYVF
jgi:maltoporin